MSYRNKTIVFSAFLLLLSIAVRAETFTAVSADDTYVAENYPDIVYPEEKIKIGFEDSGRNYGYIKFDMRIPKNVKILYANISLYHHDFRGTPPFSYEIYNLYSKFWNQETLTWKNQLCGEDTNNDYFCNLEPLDVKEVSYTGRYYEWNVTHAVLEEYKRGKNSISFALRIVGNYPGDNYSVFYNKESTASSRRPYMTIVYENNTNELSPDTKKYSVEETETNNNIPRNKYFRSFKKNIDYIKNNLYIRGVGAHGLPVSQDMNENYSLPRMVQSSAMSGSAVLYIITGNENYIAMSNDIADWLIHDQIEGYYRDIGEYGEINNLYGSVGVADRMLFLSTITHNITQQHSAERALNYHIEWTWIGDHFKTHPGYNPEPIKIDVNIHAARVYAYACYLVNDSYCYYANKTLYWVASQQFSNGSWPYREGETYAQSEYYSALATEGFARAVFWLKKSGYYDNNKIPVEFTDAMSLSYKYVYNASNEGEYFYNNPDPAYQGRCYKMIEFANMFSAYSLVEKHPVIANWTWKQLYYMIYLAPGRQHNNGSWGEGDIVLGQSSTSTWMTSFTAGVFADILRDNIQNDFY